MPFFANVDLFLNASMQFHLLLPLNSVRDNFADRKATCPLGVTFSGQVMIQLPDLPFTFQNRNKQKSMRGILLRCVCEIWSCVDRCWGMWTGDDT